jgi:hypothetical protein
MTIPVEPSVAWLPTPDDLAALLRARTKDANGAELGHWSDATRPTDVEVQTLINMAAAELTDADGPGDPCAPRCRSAVAYRAACLIELSYFPEQVRSDRSPYTELKELADAALDAFRTCLTSGTGEAGTSGEGYSYHSVPVVPAWLADTPAYGWRSPELAATWQEPLVPPSDVEPARILEPEPPPLPPIDVSIP